MSEGDIHIYRASMQPAVRYLCDAGFWVEFKPMQLLECYGCGKRRRVRNLLVQSYYDGDRFFCKEKCQ